MLPRTWAAQSEAFLCPSGSQNMCLGPSTGGVCSRQAMAELPWPARQVGTVQLLGCRFKVCQHSGLEHNGLPWGLPTWRSVNPHNAHCPAQQCSLPCRPGRERGPASDCSAQAICNSMIRHPLTGLCSPAGLAGGSNGCAQSEFLGSSTTSRPGSFEDLEEALSDTLANGHQADSQPEPVEGHKHEPLEQEMTLAEQPPVMHPAAVILAGAMSPAAVFASPGCLPGRLAVDSCMPQA